MLVVIDRFLMCFLNCSVPEFIRPRIIFYNVTLLFVRILMYIIKSLTTHQLVLYIDNVQEALHSVISSYNNMPLTHVSLLSFYMWVYSQCFNSNVILDYMHIPSIWDFKSFVVLPSYTFSFPSFGDPLSSDFFSIKNGGD